MTEEIRALVVVLRQTQWLLDELAHQVPAGGYAPNRLDHAAALLDQVAQLLRDQAGRPVIESDPQP